jgi:hypothetical protein
MPWSLNITQYDEVHFTAQAQGWGGGVHKGKLGMIVVSTRRMLTNEERLELDIINNNVISNY